MDKRRKHLDRDKEKQLRDDFFNEISRGELSIPEALKKMQRISLLTQAEFASHRGISLAALRQIQAGNGNPSVDTLNKIADIFGLEVGFVKKRKKP